MQLHFCRRLCNQLFCYQISSMSWAKTTWKRNNRLTCHMSREFRSSAECIHKSSSSRWKTLRCGRWNVSFYHLTSCKTNKWLQLVHDASAKLQSGLLNGNVNNFGDFDYCLNVDAPNDEFQGKYCLAYLQPTVTATLMYTNYLRRLMQSHGPFTSNFDDVSNWFGPRWP